MRRKSLGGLVVGITLLIAACGGEGGGGSDVDADEAVIQITSEGGFAPVELILNSGPRYTILGDGTLIFQGVTTLEFPGPLVPQYQQATLDDNQMRAVLAMIDDMGLSDIEDEIDDSAASIVADATTEVITYWDAAGQHRYGVYAPGLDETSSERNDTFLELIETLDRFTAETESEPYEPGNVRIVAGPAPASTDFPDNRPWPLDDQWDAWEGLTNGWRCRVFESKVLGVFEDATQATTWETPAGVFDFDPATLLVRPLLPGEPNCPSTLLGVETSV